MSRLQLSRRLRIRTSRQNDPHLGLKLIRLIRVQPFLNRLRHFDSRRLIATAKLVAVSSLTFGPKEEKLDYVQMCQLFTNIWGF